MRILVIHTGGTIGMVQTDHGFAPRSGVVEEAIATLLADGILQAEVEILTFGQLIDSAQATPADWGRIAQHVHQARDQHDAFVVTHGTDTLAYSAGALCLALPGLRQPVIVTGSMLPLTVEGNDGWRNLTDALQAATTAPAGVWVQFAGNLLHGGRVRKSHSSALDAFEAEPCEVIPVLPAATPALNVVMQHNVGVFSVTPGLCLDLLEVAVQRCDGLVLRCYGSGTAPDTPEMRAALTQARDRQIPVVAVSQCPEGGMKLGTYAAGRVMRDTGVIDGRDMTPEMAYVKLHFALSLGLDDARRQEFLRVPQCGELTPAT
jgi:L-asparaginase